MVKEKHYPYPVHRHKLSSSTVEIAYIAEGKGEKTLLFIHGLGHSSLGWVKNIDGLKSDFHCIALDLPGNGLSSSDLKYPYSLHFFANCIHDFIVEKELSNVYLVGHSLGGQISLLYAHLFPGQLSGLILCAPAGLEIFNSWEKTMYKSTLQFFDMLNSEENNLRQAVQNSFYKMPKDTKQLIDRFVHFLHLKDKKEYRQMINGCINGMMNEPVHAYFSEIKIPVIVIFGEQDSLIPNKLLHPFSVRDFAKNAIKDFPNSKLFIIPNCGHFLQWEKPNEVNTIIKMTLI